MTRTIDGKRYSDAAYNRRFQSVVCKALPGYALCTDDWTEARYQFNCGMSPDAAAARLIEKRRLQTAERVNLRVWRDEFDGTVRIGPSIAPAAVCATITAAFENGCWSGTVSHWEHISRGFDHMNDIRPVQYCWEILR